MRGPSSLEVVQSNIDLMLDHERREFENLPANERVAEKITAAAGSSWFLYLNVAFFTVWIAWNVGAFGLKPFDAYPFGMLTMVVSLEAIILAIFVLVSQNRMQSESDRRTELDVQVNLLTEYELTELLKLTVSIAKKLGCTEATDPEYKAVSEIIDPKEVLDHLDQSRKENGKG